MYNSTRPEVVFSRAHVQNPYTLHFRWAKDFKCLLKLAFGFVSGAVNELCTFSFRELFRLSLCLLN